MTGTDSKRQNRKLEHIRHALSQETGDYRSGLLDIHLVHQAAPELNLAEIDSTYQWNEKSLQAPLIINAITGGNREVMDINRSLSRLAGKLGIALAVGSQTAALEDRGLRDTFTVVREENTHGVIMANVSGLTPPGLAEEAVEMIRADALQVHLNVPQELAMEEGERGFRGVLDNIGRIIRSVNVPVIVKEVGFGISHETASALQSRRVEWIDIGGRGGTNFISIERNRGAGTIGEGMESWGIPTAVSLLEVLSLNPSIRCIAAGGIKNSLETAKCLCLGAEMVGIAGHFLRLLLNGSEEALEEEINRIIRGLQVVMLMAGARNLEELRQRPVVITGRTREWLEQRGIDTRHYAQR